MLIERMKFERDFISIRTILRAFPYGGIVHEKKEGEVRHRASVFSLLQIARHRTLHDGRRVILSGTHPSCFVAEFRAAYRCSCMRCVMFRRTASSICFVC